MKRIGFLILGSGIGGFEKRILNFIEYFSKDDEYCTILFITKYLYDYIVKNNYIDLSKIQIILLGNSKASKASKIIFLLKLNLILFKNYFKIDMLFTSVTGTPAVAFFSIFKKTLISIVDSRKFFSIMEDSIKSLSKISCRNAFKIDCLNPITKEYLQTEVKGIENKVFVSRCSFVKHKEIKSDVIEEKARKIVWMGRFVNNKQPLMFLEAIKEIKNILAEKKYKVFIYGEGELKDKILQYISSFGLQEIVFVGHVIDTYLELLDTEIFVSTQDHSNYPSQVLLEAMSNYCFPIATDVGDTNLLVNEITGERCLSNSQDLAKKVLEVINMPKESKKEKMIKSREYALKHNIENYKQYFISLIN